MRNVNISVTAGYCVVLLLIELDDDWLHSQDPVESGVSFYVKVCEEDVSVNKCMLQMSFVIALPIQYYYGQCFFYGYS